MGSNCGFKIKLDTEQLVYVGSFQNFYPLNQFFQDGERITEEDLKSLLNEIQPVVRVLLTYTPEQIRLYDEQGYPTKVSERVRADLAFGEFSVYDANYSFAGMKILKLYHIVKTLIEMLDPYDNPSLEVYFWS